MDVNSLWQGFCGPSDDARPRVWWHWMDGNIDPDGIVLDLEWLHRVGVRGVQMFDGGTGTPLVVPERVRHGSPQWRSAVRTAVATAQRLGMEFTVATSAGWSAAGAPFVQPADAMKKVVWSETVVEGGGAVAVQLAPLPDVAGPYQDYARWGADPESDRHSQDWIAVAVPADQVAPPLMPSFWQASGEIEDWAPLLDRRSTASVSLPRDPDGPSSAWIEQVFENSVEVSAVTVGLPGPSGFGAAPLPGVVLEVSDDGSTYRRIATIPPPGRSGKPVPIRTIAFSPVRARRFRLVLSGDSAAAALPRLAEGVLLPPVLRKVAQFTVSEFALHPGGRIHEAELKAGFAAAPDYYRLDTPDGVAGPVIEQNSVVDVTSHLGSDGVLRWDAPAGRWLVLRYGASLTGQRNAPAPPEATGLEVDKLDADRVRSYIETYLAVFDDALSSDQDGRPFQRLDALLSDSIESGAQNFTESVLSKFAELRGYDPLPWLPTLSGRIVGDAERTDRFLWDYRRTISDVLVQEYYHTLRGFAAERGMTYYAEALEDHRPQLGDDLAMRSEADIPMGAMWVFDPGSGQSVPTYIADLKGASSVAHVYGKAFTGAESMSAFHRPWSYTPRRLKHIADLELALGVTRFCIHTSPHQPRDVPPPGIGLSPFLGQVFIRTEPWAELAGPWIDYLARCSWLLNQGVPAVDVAVFVGEEAPLTSLFGDTLDQSVPRDIGFDYVNVDALESRLEAQNGDLVAGDVRYRALYLGGSSSRMTLRALRRVAELARAGGTVIGRRPVQSPSLADDDSEWRALAETLWGNGSGGGLGTVVDTDDLAAALSSLGIEPEIAIEDADLLRIGRRIGGQEVLFVANPQPHSRVVTVLDNRGRGLEVWDPVSLSRQPLPEIPGTGVGRSYRLNLAALGSTFLLPSDVANQTTGGSDVELVVDGPWRLSIPGIAKISLPNGPTPWSEFEQAAGFSGLGTYTADVVVDRSALGSHILLAVHDVGDIARIRVNGIDCGVMWTAPWQVDVTGAIRDGGNSIQIDVANAWMNRLIRESSEPTGEIFAPVAAVYAADAPTFTSGLTGPVVMRGTNRTGS